MFSLRVVYDTKCSTDILLLLSLFEKEEVGCIHEYTASGGYYFMKFRVTSLLRR